MTWPRSALVQRLDSLRWHLNRQHGASMTWRALAAEIGSVPAGTVCAVARGRIPHKRKHRRVLFRWLGRRSFEQNAAYYDAWRAANAAKLAAILAWAETPRELRTWPVARVGVARALRERHARRYPPGNG